MWDPQTRDRIGGTLHGPASGILSLAFSPDGRTLASGSMDGAIALWDVRTGDQIGNPLAGYGAVWGLAFSPDGRYLASGGGSGSTYLRSRSAWSSDTTLLHAKLCAAAGRNLTHAEWDTFLPFEPYRTTCP